MNRKSTKTVLVTGGAGYIGSHACKALSEAGYTPVVYDNLSRGHRDAVKWGPFEQGDILDRERLTGVLKRHRPCGVLHFAAFAYVGESTSEPSMYYRNNVVGMHTLLEAMREAGTQRLVFSSSCATYGIPETVPIPVEHPQRPINPYGQTKLICEKMIKDYAPAYGLRYAILRYFNAAGADPDGELGERHDPETHLIPLAIHAAVKRKPMLKVFGDDYPTEDGTCVRDYVHVSDLAAAHVRALEHLRGQRESVTVNLGTGTGYSIMEVLKTIKRVLGRNVPYEIVSRREGDPPELVASVTRVDGESWLVPEHSGIEKIVKTASVKAGNAQSIG